MVEQRIKCTLCENKVLQVTLDHQLGTCGPCYQWIQVFIHREEARQLDDFWASIPPGTSLPFKSLEEARKFISPHLDQNLINQRIATRSRQDCPYQILDHPNGRPDSEIGVVDPDEAIRLYHLMGCAPFHDPWKPPTYHFSMLAKNIPPWPMINGPIPIASVDWLLENLQLTPDFVQLLPVRVQAKDGNVPGYVALNLLRSARVWDLERSTWEGAHWNSKVPLGLTHMVAADQIRAPAPLFRNADFRPHVIVDEATGSLIRKSSPRSVAMVSIDGFSH